MRTKLTLVIALTATLALTAQQRDPQEYRQTLENPGRVAALQVDKVIATLNVTPGMRIADLGAGSGVFTIPLARVVGAAGKVYAIDIDAGLLAIVSDKAAAAGLANVVTVVAGETDPRLPEPVDVLFICDTLHHLPSPGEYLKRSGGWLRGNGRVVVIDFAPGKWPAGHDAFTITPAQVDAWMKSAGFARLAAHGFLESNFFHVYGR